MPRLAQMLCSRCIVVALRRRRLIPVCAQYSTSVNKIPYKYVPKYTRLPFPEHEKLPTAESVMQHIQKVYGATEQQCWKLMRSPKLASLPEENILDTVTTLKNSDIPLHQLLRIPWILSIEKNELKRRLDLLQTGSGMFLTASDCAGFCGYSSMSIIKFSTLFRMESEEVKGYRNRVYYMADRLNVRVPELTEALVLPKSMFVMPIWRMSQVIKLINENGVPGEMLLKDPWMFVNDLRFSAADSKNELPRYLGSKAKSWNFEERALHLSRKMNIDVCLLRAHWRDHKFRKIFSNVGFARTNTLLDERYTLNEILTNMKVLGTSEERLMKRLSVLRKANHKSKSVRFLYDTDKCFEDYCKQFVFAPSLLDQMCDQPQSKGKILKI